MSDNKPESVARRLDKLYDMIDDLLLDGKYEEVDAIFDAVDVEGTETVMLCGYLTVTCQWRKQLKSRGSFYDKVEKVVTERRGKKVAFSILRGLK